MAAKKSERSYGLSADEVKQLAEEFKAKKKLPNPHRTGNYRFIIAALVTLGANKRHSLAKVQEAFRKAAGEDWYKEWLKKEPRNETTAKDAHGRFVQNVRVLQRTSDYGRRLLDVGRRVMKTKGAVIDLTRDNKGNLFVTLNTNSATPQKPGRAADDESDNPRRPKSRKAASPASKRAPEQKAKKRGGSEAPLTDSAPPSPPSQA